jgi:acyl carrier protein
MDEIRSRLVQCFSAVFPDLNENEVFLSSVSSVASWDSVASLTLLALIEEEFQLQLDPNELEDLISFELISDYLRRQQGAS